MNIVGIIAEYNPFHNGHKYQLEMAKKLTNSSHAVIVMSGDFMQRGTPALIDKYARAKMAIENGGDMVIELPVRFATGSAESFAHGAVSILESLGVVTHLCFGSECGSIEKLQSIANVLSSETPAFRSQLKELMKLGLSYPSARNKALSCLDCWDFDTMQMLSMPNNILGIEYLRALNSFHSQIIPVTVMRLGSDYNDPAPDRLYSSALAIRSSIYQTEDLTGIADQVPVSVLRILLNEYKKTFPIYGLDCSALLQYKLLLEASEGYEKYVDVSGDLSDKIVKNLNFYTNFQDFCDLLKSKDMTHTRISRSLIHILLNITKSEKPYHVPYARILALRASSPILKEIKAKSSIPLLAKLADAPALLDEPAMNMLQEDINAAHIYQIMVCDKYKTAFQNEFMKQIYIRK